MRITNRVMNNNLLMNLNSGLTRLDKINKQLGSKKQINVPSDDPVKAGIILRTSSSIREAEQYIRNIDMAESWLDASDIVTKDILAVIHRAKELAVNGSSSYLDKTDRYALADEIKQLHGNLLQLANSTHGGRYLFAGQYTQTEPFSEELVPGKLSNIKFLANLEDASGNPIEVNPDALSLEFEIGVGVNMGVNMDGEKLFNPIFEVLQTLHAELSEGQLHEDSAVLSQLDAALDNVLQQVSELGGKENRIELAKDRLLDLRLNLTKILSEEQDLDYAEAIMELKMEEFAYRTALSIGARIIQPTLVDFLR